MKLIYEKRKKFILTFVQRLHSENNNIFFKETLIILEIEIYGFIYLNT
jgi:hypothetical protein